MLAVTVPGIPVPQGSMRALGPGRMVHSNRDKLRPWRDSVTWHLRDAMTAAGMTEPWDEPVGVLIVFILPRPASAPRRRWAPDRKPDLDKLARSCLDSLTAAGVVADDARVTDITCRKRYGQPGMHLTIAPLVNPEAAA